MNPLFDRKYYIPDGEARKMPDGRLYVYGSADIAGDLEYCSNTYYVFSTDDMENWKNNGVSFKTGIYEDSILREPVTIGGPDCIEKDGKYYLYYCTSGNGEGVAVSDTPYGPFMDPTPIEFADKDGIDPAVFIDDDGEAYYYWGQFVLKAARLKPNMRELDMSTYHNCIASEWEHGFHEGASMRKRNGLYYLVYTDITRGRATCLSYAIGKSPFGPFERKGVIIDNTGCDPRSWNNHGSIEEKNGQWYIFYHRSSMNSMTNRRMCAEPITFLEDGTIVETEMTSQGSSKPINAKQQIDASIACRLRNTSCHGSQVSLYIVPRADHGEVLTMSRNGDWAEYRYIDFGDGVERFRINASSAKKCIVEIRIESKCIGECIIDNTGSWDNWKEFLGEIKEKVTGTHAVWLFLKEIKGEPGRLADIDWFSFE